MKEVLGEPSWRDVITDQILVGFRLQLTSRIKGEYKDIVDRENEKTFTELVHAETNIPERQQDPQQELPVHYDQAELRDKENTLVSSSNDIKHECMQVMSANTRDESSECHDGLAQASCQRGNELDTGMDGKKSDMLKSE